MKARPVLTVTAINLMMHELAENLAFSIHGTHIGPIPNRREFKGKLGKQVYYELLDMAKGGFSYKLAHGDAQQYEIILRNHLKNVTGGFAGGYLGP